MLWGLEGAESTSQRGTQWGGDHGWNRTSSSSLEAGGCPEERGALVYLVAALGITVNKGEEELAGPSLALLPTVNARASLLVTVGGHAGSLCVAHSSHTKWPRMTLEPLRTFLLLPQRRQYRA